MVTIRTKLVRNLTEEEYKACHSLNMGSEGTMRGVLVDAARGYRPGARTFMAWENNRLVAWVLVFKEYNEDLCHTYVRASCRRRGIGARLMSQVIKRYPDVRCCPWNEESQGFYRTFGLQAGGGYRITPDGFAY